MEFKDFSKFYEALANKRQVPISYNNKKWFDHCINSHSELAEILGNTTVLVDTKLETTKGVAPERVVGPKIDRVLEIIPTYLGKYGISREQLKRPMLTNPRRIRTAKHIMGYAKRSDLEPGKTLDLSKEVAELGQIWEDSKNHCDTQKIVISVDPRAFIHIGCGGLNPGSCWRTGPTAKFCFGAIKNTFCFYIPQLKNDRPDQEDILWGTDPAKYTKQYFMRGLGSIDIENRSICLSNTYGSGKHISYTYLSSVWADIYRQIFDLPEEKEVHSSSSGSLYPADRANSPLSYLNATLVSLSDKKEKTGEAAFRNFWKTLISSTDFASLRK